MPRQHQEEEKEALVGVEPTMADLQSAALATWLQRLKSCYREAYELDPHGQEEKSNGAKLAG
jgi:hypothetical protein